MSVRERAPFGSIAPPPPPATPCCRTNTFPCVPSNRSAHRCAPMPASTSWPGDPDPFPGLAHAALKHLKHAQLTADLTDVDVAALVGEAGTAAITSGRGRGDLLDHAASRVVPLRTAAWIAERQHG